LTRNIPSPSQARRGRQTVQARAGAMAAAALLGLAALAGCSSSTPDQGSSSPTAQTGGSQVLPPVIIEPGQTTATAKVGDNLYINVADPVTTTVTTSTPNLVEVTQGYDDGSATFNPGATALAPGDAIITITAADGSAYDLKVTITP
ncbi:MAG: hypothetical protein ACKOE2_08730, partial [Actinomycetales bacterium]